MTKSSKWTPERRAAAGERLRLAREAKKVQVTEAVPTPVVSEEQVPLPESDTDQLKQQVAELMAKVNQLTSQPQVQAQPDPMNQGPVATAYGIKGTLERYPTAAGNYPSPVDRIKQEPRLAQLAFDINYELTYEVAMTKYDTKDGMSVKEPRFNVQINRVVFDDEGNKTNQRYIVRKAIFHEDPDTAVTIAEQQGFDFSAMPELDFLNEMRYLRIRDWVLEVFFPKPVDNKPKVREVVIGGKLVPVFEVSSEESSKVDFNALNGKKL